MRELLDTTWIELRKATRSKVPFFTLLGFLMLPLACAFMMFIYKDPEFARSLGILSAKANLAGGSADWPTYLNMLAQGTAIGGIFLFGFIVTWVFGREWSDGTLKDLMAVPVSRGAILAAKFIVVSLWSLVVIALAYGLAMLAGALLALPLWSSATFWQGSTVFAVTALLVIVDILPIAFFASVGRGYMLPLGVILALLVCANVIAIIGWGDYFPWAVPALYAGLTGKGPAMQAASFWVVILTGVVGMLVTYLWWKYADQNR